MSLKASTIVNRLSQLTHLFRRGYLKTDLAKSLVTIFVLTFFVQLAPLTVIQSHAAISSKEAADSEAVKPKTDLFGNALDPGKGPFAAGFSVYQQHCATCHDKGGERIPQKLNLRDMTPAFIHSTLEDGAMRAQGQVLSAKQKQAVAEYIANRRMVANGERVLSNPCDKSRSGFNLNTPSPYTNWGLTPESTHFIPSTVTELNRRNIGRLKLKWAYGFIDSRRMRSQPAIAGDTIILGSHTGSVRALDLETGCERWQFEATAEVRTAIIIGPWQSSDSKARPVAYFGDLRGIVYALDARNGELIWKVRADDHPAAVITGAPALYQNTLYVPISSLEEAAAATPGYICCDFRGSMLALDASTGTEKWRTFLVGEPTLTTDKKQRGPSGVAVWNSPSIDIKRGQLYIATGDNYSNPATELSDAIVAMDLETGKINWHYQALEGDAWNVACIIRASGNCPEDEGPDFDFGAGTILATDKNGREVVLAGQKSGIAYGIDPDTGKKLWQSRIGRGGAAGGTVFGLAAGNGRAYIPISDMGNIPDEAFPASPGLYALDISNGDILWRSAAPSEACNNKRGCVPGISGSVTATDELVFAGSDDGHLRIHDASSGKILWDMDTVKKFATVNQISGFGGAISGGAAPIVYQNKLIAVSGYGFSSKIPGNVLLVFELEKN